MTSFNNPPITEAIFDVKVKLPENVNLELLRTFQEKIKDQFPIKKERRKIEGGFRFEGDIPPQLISSKNEIYGYQYVASDNSKVVQARLDGFTFNKLKPYSNWEKFSEEAVSLLEHYTKITKPQNITRVALRYINRIELPLPFINFNDYILTTPTLGPKLNFPIAQFFTRFLVINNDIGALANITETIENESTEKNILPFILDIDVYKNVNVTMDIGIVMENMNQLRVFKNRLFLESLTDKALELFK